MKLLGSILTGAAFWVAPFVCADTVADRAHAGHDVYVLGEVHDNPEHHAVQARFVSEASPTAVVFEMLTPDEAASLGPVPRESGAMAAAVAGYHWDNIADYADILAASPVIVGAAADRETVRAAFADGAAAAFGDEAERYGLDAPLAEVELATREDLQFAAHCEAMPEELMTGMVEAQRLRDAAFARAVIGALEQHGPPVVLITGNGHARTDWGVPHYLAQAWPGLSVFALGQGEGGAAPDGDFDAILTDAPRVDRPDPCTVFR